MITLSGLASLFGGGPGSGCHGPSCGRKSSGLKKKIKLLTKKVDSIAQQIGKNKTQLAHLKQMKKQWKYYGDKAGLKKVTNESKYLRLVNDISKSEQRYLEQQKATHQKTQTSSLINKVANKNKAFGDLTKLQQHEEPNKIDVQPAKKYQVVKQFDTAQGHSITVIKPPRQKDLTGQTWLKKVSDQKGNFNKLMEESAFNNNKEKTAFFAAPVGLDRNTVVQVVRNLGQLRTTVKEIDLVGGNHIARTRIASFKNMGQASGFLNKRYGITFKFK